MKVFQLNNQEEVTYVIVNKKGIENKKECLSYDKTGGQVGCYTAGCYSLSNDASEFCNDLLEAIDNEFKTTYKNDLESSSFDLEELFEMTAMRTTYLQCKVTLLQ